MSDLLLAPEALSALDLPLRVVCGKKAHVFISLINFRHSWPGGDDHTLGKHSLVAIDGARVAR